jgi:hypothetical protein
MSLQEPLTRAELERLWRWERQMTWLYGAAMAGFLLAGVAANRFGDLAWLHRPLLAGAAILVVAAAVLQFRERCPRCRARLRSGILRMLPGRCSQCGVPFPRQPPADR